jgi:putative oxidoreductase
MYIGMSWILLLLRILLGVSLIYYGWPKIRDLKSNARDFVEMGFRPGMLWGTLGVVDEFFGGIAIFFGLYAELAAALFGFQMMIGTFWKILKLGKGFTEYSYDLYLLGLCLVIMSQGSGAFGLAAFPGHIFLRWDVAGAALAAALLLAVTSKPASKLRPDANQGQPQKSPAPV